MVLESLTPDNLEILCPEMKEYFEWYNREVLPRMKKLATHVVSCSQCQEILFSSKDQTALKILLTNEEELKQILERTAEK